MTDSFATFAELTARLSPAYATLITEPDAVILLQKASELVDYVTYGRAQVIFTEDDPDADLIAVLSKATCDQVEFWLEVGEEHDVLGLPPGSSLQGGRVQVQRIPGHLGQRAKRALNSAGLLWAGVRSV